MTLDFLGDLRRTHTCGELRAAHAGERVVLMGWVNRRRDLGSLIFIDVRDRTGITQAVFNAELNPALHEKAASLRSEYVVAVIGKCKRRDPETVNPNIETGEVEIVADELKILNDSKHPPFLPSESVLPNEEVRLQYRYLDLRRPADAGQPRSAPPRHHGDSQLPGGARLPGDRDSVHDPLHSRGCA